MKKIVGVVILLLVFGSILCGTVAAEISPGPAPNSGDGVSDGSGLPHNCPNPSSPGDGPAPNSGDGISDGPGW